MAEQRLQKVLAAAGLGSRRQVEAWLRDGRIRVNGQVAQLGEKADPQRDQISLDGQPIAATCAPLLILLNKPAGVLCSCSDPEGRATVLDLLPGELAQGQGLHPVGRLDQESRGAMLLTNQGTLTLRLTHPRFGHRKTYRVRVAGDPEDRMLEQWRRGLPLDGEPSAPVQLRRLQQGPWAGRPSTLLELVMREGRNRQIRRTAVALGHPVLDLERIAIGPIRLGALPEGRWRRVESQEWGRQDPLAEADRAD